MNWWFYLIPIIPSVLVIAFLNGCKRLTERKTQSTVEDDAVPYRTIFGILFALEYFWYLFLEYAFLNLFHWLGWV